MSKELTALEKAQIKTLISKFLSYDEIPDNKKVKEYFFRGKIKEIMIQKDEAVIKYLLFLMREGADLKTKSQALNALRWISRAYGHKDYREFISLVEFKTNKEKIEIKASSVKLVEHKALDKPTAFIAFVNEDREYAETLFDRLNSEDSPVKPWIYTKDKIGGVKWEQFNHDMIAKCDFLIACFSSNVTKKRTSEFHREIRIALEEYEKRIPGSIFLIPIKLEKCDIPKYKVGTIKIEKLNYINLFEPDGYGQLIRTIKTQLDSSKKSLPQKEITVENVIEKFSFLNNILKAILEVVLGRNNIEQISLGYFFQIFRTDYFREKFSRQEIETIKSDYEFVLDKRNKIDNDEKLSKEILIKTYSKLNDQISIFDKEKEDLMKFVDTFD